MSYGFISDPPNSEAPKVPFAPSFAVDHPASVIADFRPAARDFGRVRQ